METVNIKDVPLDIRQPKFVSVGDFYQNDTNIIKFTLSDNSNPADLSNVDEILINYKRPDGEIISRLLEAESNIINYQLGQSEMQVAGLGKLVLQFFSNDKRLSTFVVNVSVKKSIEVNFEFEEVENPLVDQLFEKMSTFNERLDNIVIEGGGAPPNVILFEDWVPGESVIIGDTPTPPTDTTPPILTITQGGNFTGTKSVTMSVNEAAVIYYTLDGSIPNENSQRYANPLTISATTTLKAFARDAAGNNSAVQTVTYTLVVPEPGDTTPPNNVTNLQVTDNTTGTSLTLTWTASTSSDVSGYEIYRGATLLSTVTGNSYNVTGLTANTSYTFVVKAKDTSNNVASGTSVTATAILVDATPPILTITPAATFTNTQTVTMSTNETATIYYTLDGNTPTQTSLVYSAPLTLNVTTTIKAFARDTAGNSSTVQTVVYTKEVINDTPKALLMGGSGSYVQAPSLTFDELILDITPEFVTTKNQYYFDARTNSIAFLLNNSANSEEMEGITLYVDGQRKAGTNRAHIATSKRQVLKVVFDNPITDDVTLFAHNNLGDNMNGKIYKTKFLLSGAVVADYDFTQQFSGTNVEDKSGNGKNATLGGGTWVDETPIITSTDTSYSVSLNGVDNKIFIPMPSNVKYAEIRLSRESNDTSGYVFDTRVTNTIFSSNSANAGYNGFSVDGVVKSVSNTNATTDLPNGVASTAKYTFTTLTKSGNLTIGGHNSSTSATDYMSLKVYAIKFYNELNEVMEEFDFTTGEGTTLYGSNGMRGSISGGTWEQVQGG